MYVYVYVRVYMSANLHVKKWHTTFYARSEVSKHVVRAKCMGHIGHFWSYMSKKVWYLFQVIFGRVNKYFINSGMARTVMPQGIALTLI